MRIVRSLTLLVLVSMAMVAATAADRGRVVPRRSVSQIPRFSYEIGALPAGEIWKISTGETVDSTVRTDLRKLNADMLYERSISTCYFIRSYARKRLDGTDETVPAGMTTCTPAARFQIRRSAPRK
jgi:hypothetical protein